MAGYLSDDGTMDTVICCDVCGHEDRFNFDPGPGSEDGEQSYDEFVADCIQQFDDEHVCEDEDGDDEPDEDAITTPDHQRFYQYGKLAFEVTEDSDGGFRLYVSGTRAPGRFETIEQAVSAYNAGQNFWPNVFFVSDHGNAHLMTL